MTTPNIEELILKLRGQAYTTCRPDQLCDQAADLLQSQTNRIKELEQSLQTGPEIIAGLFVRAVNMEKERDALRAELATIAATEPVSLATDQTDEFGEVIYREVFTRPMPAQGVEACMINLPEPVAWLANYGGNVYTEAQLKQAVRDALDAQGVNAEFVRVIQFAISQDSSASDFLHGWLHGDTDEWPEFTNAKGVK